MISLALSFKLSPSLDLVSLSFSQSYNSFTFFPCLILVKILPQSLVFLMDLPVSSHFFLKLQWENGFSSQIASLHTCLIPLELKISLTDSFCLCGPSKVHCNPYLPVSWLSLHRGLTCSWCHPPHPCSTSCIQCSYFTSTWTFIFITYNHLWYHLWIHCIQPNQNDNSLQRQLCCVQTRW